MSEALAEPAVVEPAEPAAVEPAEQTEPAAAAPSAPNWEDPALLDLVDARAQALVQQQFGEIAPLLEQFLGGDQIQPGQGQPQLPALVDEFGQVDPNALAQLISRSNEQLLSQVDQRIQQIQAPMAARFEQETIAEGNQRLNDILVDDIARNGEFSTDQEADKKARTLVRTLAEQAFPAVAQRYGPTPRAAELAMSQSASMIRELLSADRAASLTTEQNRVNALAGARQEPGAAFVGVEGLSDKPLSSLEIAQKYGQKATALTGA